MTRKGASRSVDPAFAHGRLENARAYLAAATDLLELTEALGSVGRPGTVLDGEIVRLKQDEISSFAELQQALSTGETADLVYYAFDLLFLDGVDLRQSPLEQRKILLAEVIADAPAKIRLSEHRVGGGKKFYARACALKLEGIISKRRKSLYSGT